MSTGAVTDAHSLRAVLRFPEHDRVSGCVVPVASRHLRKGSFVRASAAHGCFDVRVVLDWNEECTAQSTGENDGLHVSADDDSSAAQHGIGIESLLHSAECGGTTAAMAAGARARKGATGGIRRTHAACHLYWSRNATN